MSEQPGPGWYADPTRRYEHRYWDGGTWTEHVARNGEAATDPLDGSADPAQTWTSQTWQAQAGSSTRTNAKAIVSLVLSLIWVGGLASVVAIVLGVLAKREIRERPDEGGSGIATAGIVLGVLGVLGAMVMLVAFLSFFAFGSETMYVETR